MSEPMVGAELKRGAALQLRIIGALLLREVRTRFGQYRFGYAWALLEPLVQIGLLSIIFYVTGARPSLGTSFETFFCTGFVTFAFFRDLAGRTASSITANRALLSFPPVRNMDTVWARITLEVATNMTALAFVVLIFVYLGIPIMPNDPLRVFFGLLSAISLGAGVGIFNAAFSPIAPPWMMIFQWFMRIQYFASGVFFLPERLPPFAADILRWNPVGHSIVIVREGFYAGYKSSFTIEYYPFLAGGIAAILGLSIEKFYRRKVSQR